MKTGELVTIKDLKVRYDTTEVLDCPALEVRENDFIGVIGPNGGGKTTLIKALLKSIPYQGIISYSAEIEHNGIRRIGYLPQIHQLDKSFPIEVIEVVLSGLQAQKGFFKSYTRQDRLKAKELLELIGINHLSRKNIGTLSGGEFQRMMLCRALISDPVLLILDEPNTFVDSNFEGELYRLLARLNDKMAIIIVSHDLGIIMRYTKSVVCVNHSVHHHSSSRITPDNS